MSLKRISPRVKLLLNMLASESTHQGLAFHSRFDFGFSIFALELDTLYETPSRPVWFIICAYGPCSYCCPVLPSVSPLLYLINQLICLCKKDYSLLEELERQAFEDLTTSLSGDIHNYHRIYKDNLNIQSEAHNNNFFQMENIKT